MDPEPGRSLLQSDRLSRDFIAVGEDDTAAQALAKVRDAPETTRIFYCYACGPDGRLRGVVPVRKLIRAAPDERIASLMYRSVVKLPWNAPDSLVEDFFATYRFLAFPVVDDAERILGVIEVDRIAESYSDTLLDEVEGRVRDDVFRSIGLPKGELQETRPLRMALRRFPFLLVNIAGGFLAATLARLFEQTLERIVAVAAFIPMVLVLSESLGVQVAAMASHEGGSRAALRREVWATAMAGAMAAVVVALLGTVYSHGPGFPLSVFAAVLLSTSAAGVLGAVLPFAFRRLGVDPHLAAAPLVLAISDNLTLLLYFTLATHLAR